MMIICRFAHPVERRSLPEKNSVNTAVHLLNNPPPHLLYLLPLNRFLR